MDSLTQAVLSYSQAPAGMHDCASMTSSDTPGESRKPWQSFKQRGQVNVIAHLCQKESAIWELTGYDFPICSVFFHLFVPSHLLDLACWRNIGVWMLEGESEAQMRQRFPGVVQVVCLVDFKPLDGW